MKEKYKYVFVVLVYRNTEDIIGFVESAQALVSDSKIVIVNSFFDSETKEIFQDIARKYYCDFVNIENKGYGYGNNRGIDLASERYDYEYIIVSNPDIEIKKFNDVALHEYRDRLIGPLITTTKGKSQNPYWVIENRIFESIIHLGYKYKSRPLLYLGIVVNKLIRELYLGIFTLSERRHAAAFALHGSFVIFPRNVIEKVSPHIYDEAMFLFAEEADLAHELKYQNIPSVIIKDIAVEHKEDGSMELAKINEKAEARKSVMYYYAKHHDRRR